MTGAIAKFILLQHISQDTRIGKYIKATQDTQLLTKQILWLPLSSPLAFLYQTSQENATQARIYFYFYFLFFAAAICDYIKARKQILWKRLFYSEFPN